MSTEYEQAIETAIKTCLEYNAPPDDNGILFTGIERETGEVPTLKWRLFHVDDEPAEIDEETDYPALELAIAAVGRVHAHDPMLLQARGQVIAMTHYGRDRKRQYLSQLTAAVTTHLLDRGRWTHLDLALPETLGLAGLTMQSAEVEMPDNLQAQAWNINLHLITTTADTPFSS